MGKLLVSFLTYLIPQRSQVLKSLRLGDQMVKDVDGLWTISSAGVKTKNNMVLAPYKLPRTVSTWCDNYIKVYRPILVGERLDHRYVFVTFLGDGPRTDIVALVASTVRTCLGVEVSPHKFRAVIASALYAEGNTSVGDLSAVARSMLTSTDTLLKHYIKVNPAVDYSRAQDQLDSVLGKRQRSWETETDEHDEQQPREGDEEEDARQ